MTYDNSEPITTANLLRRIEDAHARLAATYEGASDDDLARPGPDGWAAKDHIIHLSAWERSLLGLLRGQDRTAAMGLDPALVGHDTGALNDAFHALHRLDPAPAVLAAAAATHAELLATISAMSDDDLVRPYSHYQPNDPPHNPSPVVGWIAGNTFGHYDEHAQYIATLLADRRS